MWEIYGALIDEISEDIKVSDFAAEMAACLVFAGGRMCISETVRGKAPRSGPQYKAGLSLKEAAKGIKFWDYWDRR